MHDSNEDDASCCWRCLQVLRMSLVRPERYCGCYKMIYESPVRDTDYDQSHSAPALRMRRAVYGYMIEIKLIP